MGEPRLSASTWGHCPGIWAPYKEMIKASSRGLMAEPTGTRELKKKKKQTPGQHTIHTDPHASQDMLWLCLADVASPRHGKFASNVNI